MPLEALVLLLALLLVAYLVAAGTHLEGTVEGGIRRGPRPHRAMSRSAPRRTSDHDAAALSYHPRTHLLSASELAFCRVLVSIVPAECVVFAKVRVADVINCDERSWDGGGWRIGSKHVDFVVTDGRTTAILLAVELDDSSHHHPSRLGRDHLLDGAFASAGVPLIRVLVSASYDREGLRCRVLDHLADRESAPPAASPRSPAAGP